MFAPEEFIHLAREIGMGGVRLASPAARARTAHGRTYYGLFLIVRSILVGHYGMPPRRIEHGKLFRHLQHSSIKGELRELGRELERLYAFRQRAGYELSPSPEWQARVEDPQIAALAAVRALAIAEHASHLDFTPVVHLFF